MRQISPLIWSEADPNKNVDLILSTNINACRHLASPTLPTSLCCTTLGKKRIVGTIEEFQGVARGYKISGCSMGPCGLEPPQVHPWWIYVGTIPRLYTGKKWIFGIIHYIKKIFNFNHQFGGEVGKVAWRNTLKDFFYIHDLNVLKLR